MKLSQLKKYWIVAFANGNVAHWSIAATKRQCIENYLEGTGFGNDWKKSRQRGHRCLRVNVHFVEVAPPLKKLTPATEPIDWYADPGNSAKVDL